jgi:AcrR family transcriptional regulator
MPEADGCSSYREVSTVAARVGLCRADVIAAAAAQADEEGYETLNVTVLAHRLGIRSQSVYGHVGGIEEIRAALQMLSYRSLGEHIRGAVGDITGREAITVWVNAHLQFDLAHPGLFAARNRPPGDDPHLWEVINHSSETSLAVLASYGLEGEDAMHFARLVWATLFGFVSMHHAGLFTMPVDPRESLRRTIEGLADQIEHRSRELGCSPPMSQPARVRRAPRQQAPRAALRAVRGGQTR